MLDEELETWRKRPLDQIEYLVIDARYEKVRVPWQRCQFHLSQNAMHHTPKVEQRKAVAEDIRNIFAAKDA